MTDDRNDAALDQLFEAARRDTAAPTPEFLARLQADAISSVPKPLMRPAPRPARSNWLGGLFTASGLSGAALAGIWIGFAMPETLDTFTLTTDESVALSAFLPSADLGALFDE